MFIYCINSSMKITELSEGRVKDLAINADYDRIYGEQPLPSVPEVPLNYYVDINGKPWSEKGKIKPFADERSALKAANAIYNKNPKLRVSALPYKKIGPEGPI